MHNRTLSLLPLALTAAALSACSFEAGPTVSGESLAEAAADAIEGEIGSRPEFDCGDEDIIAEADKEVDCTMTDSATGEEYDATVTFTGVDGDEWDIEVSVPDAPTGQAEEPTENGEEPTQGSEGENGDPGGTISGADLAAAAADALESEMGTRPEIDCGDADIVPEEGRTVYCTLIDGSAEYETTVTFTGFDGTNWSIDVQVAPEPK